MPPRSVCGACVCVAHGVCAMPLCRCVHVRCVRCVHMCGVRACGAHDACMQVRGCVCVCACGVRGVCVRHKRLVCTMISPHVQLRVCY